MVKKKNKQDIFYPVPKNFMLKPSDKPAMNRDVMKLIVQASVKGAYYLKDPAHWDYHGNPVKAKAVATSEQVEMIVHLIESLQPADAIEAALASQFAITYIRGLNKTHEEYSNNSSVIELFEFGHQVLEALQKYRTKGAQLIQVQYNHNQAQINNYKVVEKDNSQDTIEVN